MKTDPDPNNIKKPDPTLEKHPVDPIHKFALQILFRSFLLYVHEVLAHFIL